jgi:hypothetical protein
MKLDEIRSAHPFIFAVRFRGIECGPGWTALIDSTVRELATERRDIRIVQIKEKMGGLRIYLEERTDETAKGILRRAEALSFSVCEVCGVPGRRLTSEGWARVRCETHGEL